MTLDARVVAPTADLVRVRDAWNGWHTAEVPRSEIHDVRWLRPDGAPQPILHARIRCSEAVTRTLPHRCGAPDVPHDVGVCVLKNDVPTTIYQRLVADAAAHGPR